MPISINELRQASNRSSHLRLRTLSEAHSERLLTIFLCHSHYDQIEALGVVALLAESGCQAYVDWKDASMPDLPTYETAARIQRKIDDLDYFLFLATANSMSSRWCPWELGYANGKKQLEQILILPTEDQLGTHGSEYINLYRRIEKSTLGELGVWRPHQHENGVLLRQLRR
jgi:hypothetical protein